MGEGVDGRLVGKVALGQARQRQADGSGERGKPGAVAVGAQFAALLLPAEPRFLDRLLRVAALDVGNVKRFAETPAGGAPASGGVVAEIFRVERSERPAAAAARIACRVDGLAAGVIDGEECTLANGEAFGDQLGGVF